MQPVRPHDPLVGVFDDGEQQTPVLREPLWYDSQGRNLWAWIHTAPDSQPGGDALVICSPFGHEQVHAYRSVRRLADVLATSGYPVLRFDYYATGDSEGEPNGMSLVDVWLADIEAAIGILRQRGIARIHLLGIRSGALLAAASHRHIPDGGSMILWDPIDSGKRLERELKATSRMAYFASDPENLEASGYVYSTAMRERLRDLVIVDEMSGADLPVLLIGRDNPVTVRLGDALSAAGAASTVETSSEFEPMLLEPHHGRPPYKVIARTVRWMSERRPEQAASKIDKSNGTGAIFKELPGDGFLEKVVEMGDSAMFGIYCQPAADYDRSRPIILLGNSGSVYHIGPNRIYVTLARRLARAGFSSVRYDLPTIGDGLKYPHAEENFAYPVNATGYISEAIDFARRELGYDSVVLTGFCSGATQAFVAAVAQKDDSALIEALLVNPKVFYRDELGVEGDSLVMRRASYYKRAVRDPERWRRLLKGDIDFRQLWDFVGGRIRQRARRLRNRIFGSLGADAGTRLGNDLLRFMKTGRRLSFFFSSRDPGFTVLLESSGGVARRLIDAGDVEVTVIEDADHTLIRQQCRDAFMRDFIAQLSKTYPSS